MLPKPVVYLLSFSLCWFLLIVIITFIATTINLSSIFLLAIALPFSIPFYWSYITLPMHVWAAEPCPTSQRAGRLLSSADTNHQSSVHSTTLIGCQWEPPAEFSNADLEVATSGGTLHIQWVFDRGATLRALYTAFHLLTRYLNFFINSFLELIYS